MPEHKGAAIRKRQQIDSSRRTMLLFVAGSAFVVGAGAVIAFFLVKQILFHSAVIFAKQDTIGTLDANKKAVDGLKNNIRALEANEALNAVKVSEASSALQTILDALPAQANADALGASIQKKLVNGIEGLTLESIVVQYTTGESGDQPVDANGRSVVAFTMRVSGPASSMKNALLRFEKSIRTITVTHLEIQAADNGTMSMDLAGQAYFEPAKKVELGKKVVRP